MEWDKETVEIGSCHSAGWSFSGHWASLLAENSRCKRVRRALKDRLARKDLQDRQVPLGRAGPSSVL